MDSLLYSCCNIEDYSKAFHLFLQYFYHLDVLTKPKIIEWAKSTSNESTTLKLVRFLSFRFYLSLLSCKKRNLKMNKMSKMNKIKID